MSDFVRVLEFVRQLKLDATTASETVYKDGFIAACEDIEEWVEDVMWEEGIDEPVV